jgi:hypothetical protein
MESGNQDETFSSRLSRFTRAPLAPASKRRGYLTQRTEIGAETKEGHFWRNEPKSRSVQHLAERTRRSRARWDGRNFGRTNPVAVGATHASPLRATREARHWQNEPEATADDRWTDPDSCGTNPRVP